MALEHLKDRHVIVYEDELDWLRKRQLFITASEGGALSTPPCSKRYSRFSLYHGKRTPAELPPPRDYSLPGNQLLLHGHASEPMTALVHSTLTGRTLHNIGEHTIIGDALGNSGDPSILSCSPDYLMDPAPGLPPNGNACALGGWHPTPADGPGILQAKNPSVFAYARDWADGVPPWILLQNQIEMACAGVTWGTVALTVGGNRHYFLDQQFRPNLVAGIREQARQLLFDIASGIEPAPDETVPTEDTLRSIYDEAEDETLLLPPESVERWQRLNEAAGNAERWSDVERGARNWFRQIMGNTQYAIIPEVGRVNHFRNGHGGRTLRFPKVANANKARKLAARAGLL